MASTKKPDRPPRIRKRAGHYHHGDLREALILAAEQQVAKTGVVDLSLREVAAAAGVTHAAAYRHFQGKVELLAELACRGFRQLEARLVAVTQHDTGTEQLVELGTEYVAFALQCPGLFRVMFHPSIKPFADFPELDRAARAALLVLRHALVELRGGPATEEVSRTQTMAAWSTIHGHAVLQLERQLNAPFGIDPTDADRAARSVFRILIHGLKLSVA
ncbi:MAG TPA: TetR-like C-terminal domain-containing protein [Polyangiaceae bacterium]|nr:TetR-like C-terminal domain-containing protein [Polyangiaceae bacterium]